MEEWSRTVNFLFYWPLISHLLVSTNQIGWAEYLEAVKTLRAQNVEEKVTLFLKLSNIGENGFLNRGEINRLCALSLEMARHPDPSKESDLFFEKLVGFFTDLFFETFSSSENEEIAVSEIIEFVGSQETDEINLFLSLCGRENEDAIDRMTMYDNPEQKIMEEVLKISPCF